MNLLDKSVASAASCTLTSTKEAAECLKSTMIAAGYLPDGPHDGGLPSKQIKIEKSFRNVLSFLTKEER